MFKRIWAYLTEEDYEIKHQIRGVRVLVLLCVVVLFAPVIWHQFIDVPKDYSTNISNLDSLKLIYTHKKDSLDNIPVITNNESIDYNQKNENSAYRSIKPKYQSKNVPKGFVYKKPSYAIKEALHEFDLNLGEVSDFTQVSGIGDVFAGRIIKFRSKLGGFFHGDQLYEVYGIDSVVVQKILPLVKVNQDVLTKIQINKVSFKVLLKHPYFDYEDVKLVFNNRPILSSDMFCRIFNGDCQSRLPYLDFVE